MSFTDSADVPDADIAAAGDMDAMRAAAAKRVTRQVLHRGNPALAVAEPPTIGSDEDIAALPDGTVFIAPDGSKRKKPYTVTSDEDLAAVPEGENFVDPEGTMRFKPKFEPIDFTAQTLHNMATNDKERRRALERSYPGMVQDDEALGLHVNDNGTLRKPKPIMDQNVGSILASQAAPVIGSVAGEIGGAALGALGANPGTVIGGAIAGGAAGGAVGQSFNDVVLQLAGVYDRSGSEQAWETGQAAAFGGAGSAVGRGVAAAYPAAKSYIQNALPRTAAKFLGADEKGLETAIALREKGVDVVPPSGWAKESPHLQNVVEVFDPAFRTQKPLLQAATKHYEESAGKIFKDVGVTPEGSIAEPAAAPSTREAGEAILQKRVEASRAADERLQAELQLRRAQVETQGVTSVTDKAALESAAADAQREAQKLIDAGFVDIQQDINGAMKVAEAGHNSGDLWWAVGEKLKAIKQGIQKRAAKMYGDADLLAGNNLPNISGLPQTAEDFLRQLPEGFEKQHPAVVGKIRDLAGVPEVDKAGNLTGEWIKPPVDPTFGQLHELRSILRANYNYLDLSPTIKEGTFKFFANKVDAILNDVNAVPALKEAAKALRAADDFYRDSIRPLTDKNIQAVMSGLESGMPADPKNLYNTLVKEGRSELTREVAKMIGPNLWAGVKAADVQEMLDLSKTLVPGEIDGKSFVRQVLNRVRSGMLDAVHGPEAAKLVKQAQAIEALQGRLPIKAGTGDSLSDVIAKAQAAAEAAKGAATADPLKTLAREMKLVERDHAREVARLRRDDPLGFIYNPTVGATEAVDRILSNEDLILAAGARFAPDSAEFNALRQVWAQRLLQGTLEPGKRLGKVSPEVQAIMFPGASLAEMQTLAKEMDFLMSTRGAQDTAKSMAAQAKVEHPWSSIVIKGPIGVSVPGMDAAGRSMLGNYYKLVTTLANNVGMMKWILKGVKGDPAAREMARQVTQNAMNRGGAAGAAAGGSLSQADNEISGEPSDMASLPHRAEGGPASGPTVVGERGKEIFVPDQPGTIIPHDQTEAILANPSLYERFVSAMRGARQATDLASMVGPSTDPGQGGFWEGYARNAAGVAPQALRAGGVRMMPTASANPKLMVGGRWVPHTDQPRFTSAAVRNSPLAAGAAATSALDYGSTPEAVPVAAPAEAPPMPLYAQSAMQVAPPAPAAPEPEPEPEPEPAAPPSLEALATPVAGSTGKEVRSGAGKQAAKKPAQKQKAPDPTLMERLARALGLDTMAQPARQRVAGHYEEGGEPPVGQPAEVGEGGRELFIPQELAPVSQNAQFERPPLPEDPFERAALRQRGGKPTPEAPPVATPDEMAQATMMLATPGPARAIAAAPKLATAALTAYYGLSSTEQGGAADDAPLVKKLQTELRDGGFYKGEIDGRMGPATQRAKEAFDQAEQVRIKNEREQQQLLNEGRASEAALKKAEADAETAKAAAAETKRKGEAEAQKSKERETGEKRLREMESNLSTTQKTLRDYGTPIGFTAGLVGGKALQSTVAKIYNKIMSNRSAQAESLYEKSAPSAVKGQPPTTAPVELATTPERVARVNEFSRKGGGEVPFLTTPGANPGFAANPKATSMDKLYAPPTAVNLATDAVGVGTGAGESAAAHYWMVEPRKEELRLANEAVAADPSEVNINRLQDAKDKLAVAEALETGGRAAMFGYGGGAMLKGREHVTPKMNLAEAEKMDLEAILRKSQAAKKAVTKPKAAKEAPEPPRSGPVRLMPIGSVPSSMGKEAWQARQIKQGPSAYAEGGRPLTGEAAQVGEEGRELFIPDRHMPPEINPASMDSMINGTRVDQSKWPTDADVAQARNADAAYGTKAAGFTEAGKSKTREIALRDVPLQDMKGFEDFEDLPLKTVSPEQADRIYRQWLGAQKSAIAALGFDPHRTASSPQHKIWKLDTAGTMYPKADAMWYDRNEEDAAVHESIHRGLELLKKSGVDLPYANEEMITRKAMLKLFGELEKRGRFGVADTAPGAVGNQQVVRSKDYVSDKNLASIEAAAAKLYAQKGFNRRNSTANAPTQTIRGPQ